MQLPHLTTLLWLVVATSCKRSAPAAPLDDAAAPSAVAPAALAPSASTLPSAPPPLDPVGERKLYRAAFSRGHAAAARSDWADAISALDEALAHGVDARALGERGFAKLQLDDLEGAEHDFEAARALGSSAVIAAQIWYNLGLVRERRGEADTARVAFATSQSLRRTSAAAVKLEGLSTCLASISRAPLRTDFHVSRALSWQQTWEGIHSEDIVGPYDGAPSAKDAVCTSIATGEAYKGPYDACDGPPPWIVAHDRYWFTWHAHALFPSLTAPDKLLTVDLGTAGGWALKCQGSTSSTAESHDWIGHLETTYDGHDGVTLDQETNESGSLDLVCGDGTGSVTDTFFDLRSGAVLLEVERTMAPGAHKPLSQLDFTGHVVAITGGACHERIDLDKKGAVRPTP